MPDLESGDTVHSAILKLATISNTADKIPNLPTPKYKTPLPRMIEHNNTRPPLPRVETTKKGNG